MVFDLGNWNEEQRKKLQDKCAELFDPLELNHEDGPWVCGGAILRLVQGESLEAKDADVDLFFRTAEALCDTNARLRDWVGGLAHTSTTPNGNMTTWLPNGGFKVHTIARTFDNPAAVLEFFDFRVCQWAYTGRELIVGKHTPRDAYDKFLAPNNLDRPAHTILRIARYAQRGYTVEYDDAVEFCEKAARVVNLSAEWKFDPEVSG